VKDKFEEHAGRDEDENLKHLFFKFYKISNHLLHIILEVDIRTTSYL
jgi:hypothetical protein